MNTTTTHTALKALSTAQETRLISYLDDEFTALSRQFETRRSPLSSLPTIEAYLTALTTLHSLILSIPPTPPSSSLRVAYYLRLTSHLPDALASYPLPLSSLPLLWTALRTFDAAWLSIFAGLAWDAAAQAPIGSEPGHSGVRGTDRVRLESIVRETRERLGEALGVRKYVHLRERVDVRTGEVEGLDGRQDGLPGVQRVEKIGTPGLVEDDGESAADVEMEDQRGEDSDDDDEAFEEVEVVSPSRELDAEESFSIHFAAPPVLARSPVEVPAVRRREELEEDFGMAGMRESSVELDDEDEDEEGLEAEVDKVFAETMKALEAAKA